MAGRVFPVGLDSEIFAAPEGTAKGGISRVTVVVPCEQCGFGPRHRDAENALQFVGSPRLLELLFVSINIDESPRGFETLLQFQDCEQKGPRFNGEDERARMCVLPAFVRTIVSVPCLLFGQRMHLASRASVTKAEESVTVVEDFALYSQTLETSSYAIRRRNIFLLLKTIQFRYERMTREKLNFKVRFVQVARWRKHVKGRRKEKSEMGSLQDLSRYS